MKKYFKYLDSNNLENESNNNYERKEIFGVSASSTTTTDATILAAPRRAVDYELAK